MWYQDTELLGSGVQPEWKKRQSRRRAAGHLKGLGTSRGSFWPVFLCIPNRPTAFQEKMALGSGQ